MVYDSAWERKEILTGYNMCEPWGHKLSEISQNQKDKHCMIPLLWGTQSSQIQRDRK